MDRIADSGSVDGGSTPPGITLSSKAISLYLGFGAFYIANLVIFASVFNEKTFLE